MACKSLLDALRLKWSKSVFIKNDPVLGACQASQPALNQVKPVKTSLDSTSAITDTSAQNMN